MTKFEYRWYEPLISMKNNIAGPVTLPLPNKNAVKKLAEKLAPLLCKGDIIGLSGDIGIGKTVFARFIIKTLASMDKIYLDHVPSPTFTLVQNYKFLNLDIFHIDLYRIQRPHEVHELGIDDIFADGVALIEWPERLGMFLPRNWLQFKFGQGTNHEERTVDIISYGKSYKRRMDALIYG